MDQPAQNSHNFLLAVACCCVASISIASVVTGHDQLEVCVGAIVALAGGAPTALAFMQQRASDRAAANAKPLVTELPSGTLVVKSQ